MLHDLKKVSLVAISGILFALLPTVSNAQFNLGGTSSFADELGVEIVPTYPGPNETVFINLSLYTGDLNSAEISWYLDGKLVSSGTGETSYSFTTRPAGQATKIEIRVSLMNGPSFSKTITLNPASVDLIWESNSYTPPFYQGKAMHPMQGTLKIVAMPEFVKSGNRIPASKLIYEWSDGNKSYQSQSGYGRNVLVLNGSILGIGEKVEILVRDPASGMTARSSININPIEPKVVFYENSPYYGHIFNSALSGSFKLTGEEIQVVATPFYFSNEQVSSIKYDWRLNGTEIKDLSGSRSAIFRKPEEGSGRSNINLSVENLSYFLQRGTASLGIEFDE